ncbi:hypothetical protein [Reichenbachiella versicolor]|uniref:hypothetical protein n=1 Tax=Reichenbachiella versicolor TaxID=1821036 RepID=UPI000D6DD7DF|nr:hypothetical protein [Reichenbachiella versicolor]
MIQIQKVDSKKDLKRFIDFPHDLYKNDDNYVPELFVAQKDLMDKKNHPFFKHSTVDFFLALKNNEVVGRIAAIQNNNFNAYTDRKVGHFGFFESIDDYEVAEKLLDTASKWIKEKDLTDILGPTNYSTNETCGTLVEGHNMSPTLMMPYNPPYYDTLLKKYGMEKDMDLVSYWIKTEDVPDKLINLSSKILERLNSKGITIRKPNMKNFNDEVDRVFKIYNQAWEKNWGFVPFTEEEFKHNAKDMKLALDPDFLLIAEHNGEAIGFSLSLPDMNMAFKRVKRGRLLPFGIFKLLYFKRKINKVRVLTLGIVEEYRKLGIDAYFYMKAFEEAKKKGYVGGEASWVLENNEMMNKALQNINGEIYKKHRMYKKSLS